MAYTPSVFTPSIQGDILVKESELLETGRQYDTKKSIVAGQAILMNQDPRLTLLMEGNGVGQKCVGAKVVALRTCDSEVETELEWTCEPDTALKAGTEALTLNKEILAKHSLTVDDDLCRNAFGFEEILAEYKLRAKVNIEVALTRKIVALLAANADTPDATWFETPGSVVGDTYQIGASDFKSDVYADILAASQLTYMNDPIILNGRNLFNDTFLAQFKGAACCDNDQVLLGSPFQYYFDLHNIDQVLGGKYTLSVDKNASIFWSAPEFLNSAPMLMAADTYHWSETLPRLQYFANGTMNPIFVDIKAKRFCINGNTYGWHMDIYLNGALKINLANCDGRNGILKIRNGDPIGSGSGNGNANGGGTGGGNGSGS
jgi:hypothetical protein